MKRYRLLSACQLWQQIQALPPRLRRTLYHNFDRLEEAPDALSEFQLADQSGRLLDGFILGQLAFYYWIDFGIIYFADST